jgi:hypothetical protein
VDFAGLGGTDLPASTAIIPTFLTGIASTSATDLEEEETYITQNIEI